MEEKRTGRKKGIIIGAAVVMILILLVLLLMRQNQLRRQVHNVPFIAPVGLMAEEDGSIYVSDEKNHNIIRMNGDTRELVAGYTLPLDAHGVPKGSYADGSSEEALFDRPFALVRWLDGIVVSDTGNHCLRLITDTSVRTLAGTGVPGCQNGIASQASFHSPRGLAVDDQNQLYIADSENGVIRKMTEDGTVETLPAELVTPTGLCWYDGALYIADAGSSQILKLEGGELTVVAGRPYFEEDAAMTDGEADEAVFSAPLGLTVVDGVIYVADTGFSAVRRIKDGKVETIRQFEGTGSNLWPARPVGIVEQNGVLYVADSFAGIIFTITL